MDRPYTLLEAAEKLGYHPHHLGRLLRSGVASGELVEGRWLVTREEVDRLLSLQDKHGRRPARADDVQGGDVLRLCPGCQAAVRAADEKRGTCGSCGGVLLQGIGQYGRL